MTETNDIRDAKRHPLVDPYLIDRKIEEARRLRAEEMARLFRALFRRPDRKTKATAPEMRGLSRA